MNGFIRATIFVALSFFGCSHQPPLTESLDLGTKPRVAHVSATFVEQTPLLCGPTALYMAVHHLRPRITLDEMTKIVFTPGARGTYKQDLLAGARRLGFAPYRVISLYEMITQLAENRPVIVFHSAGFLWQDYWHYSVLTGYDIDRETFSVHIGPFPNYEVPMRKMLHAWQEGGHWAYVIVTPEEIPEFATREEARDNAVVFQRLENTQAAKAILRAARQNWPAVTSAQNY